MRGSAFVIIWTAASVVVLGFCEARSTCHPGTQNCRLTIPPPAPCTSNLNVCTDLLCKDTLHGVLLPPSRTTVTPHSAPNRCGGCASQRPRRWHRPARPAGHPGAASCPLNECITGGPGTAVPDSSSFVGEPCWRVRGRLGSGEPGPVSEEWAVLYTAAEHMHGTSYKVRVVILSICYLGFLVDNKFARSQILFSGTGWGASAHFHWSWFKWHLEGCPPAIHQRGCVQGFW